MAVIGVNGVRLVAREAAAESRSFALGDAVRGCPRARMDVRRRVTRGSCCDAVSLQRGDPFTPGRTPNVRFPGRSRCAIPEVMAHRVCPWWLGYLLVNPLRRLVQNPLALLRPYVAEGMTVLEPGPGMGFFTLDLARLVGPAGRVVAVDVQPRMLEALRRRAHRAGLADRIEVRLAERDTLGLVDLEGKVDVVIAFAVVHELPSAARFFSEAAAALKPGGRLVLGEPSGHVPERDFVAELAEAADAGLLVSSRPSVWRSRAAVLVKR